MQPKLTGNYQQPHAAIVLPLNGAAARTDVSPAPVICLTVPPMSSRNAEAQSSIAQLIVYSRLLIQILPTVAALLGAVGGQSKQLSDVL